MLIGEGTSDIQKMIIGRSLLKDYKLKKKIRLSHPDDPEEVRVAQRVVLHVGSMKSGTTYLQNGLIRGAPPDRRGRRVLRGAGLFPRPDRRGRRHGPLSRPGLDPKPWQRLVGGNCADATGVAVFSQEFLKLARPARASPP